MARRGKEKFGFYIKWWRHVGKYPVTYYPIKRGSVGTYKAFVHCENTGEVILSVRHPQVLLAAINGKKSINMHITMYAEDIAKYRIAPQDLQEWFPWWPEWVLNAILKNSCRIIRNRMRYESK